MKIEKKFSVKTDLINLLQESGWLCFMTWFYIKLGALLWQVVALVAKI